MDDRLLKFARIVEADSFTAAAARLHISQPALSLAVSQLERELGAGLLIRPIKHPLQLTPAGQLAYAAAKEMAVTTANLKTSLAGLGDERQALAIGLTDSIAAALFRSNANVRRLDNQAHVLFVVDNSRQLYHSVIHDELDAAVAVARPEPAASLSLQPVGIEPLVLVCHRDRAKREQRAIDHGQLPAFIGYDRLSTTFRLIEDSMRSHHLAITYRFNSTSPELILRLVLLQRGTAVLPWQQVANGVAEGTLVPLRSPGGPLLRTDRPILYITRRRRQLPAGLTGLVEQLTNVLATQQLALNAQDSL